MIRPPPRSPLFPSPTLFRSPAPVTDASQSAFDKGLADTLNSRLSELSARHALAVIPMNETIAKGTTTVDAAREQFGVNLVLTLHIQRTADNARVNYSLIDTRSHQQVRGGSVTTAAGDPFALQDRVFERDRKSTRLNSSHSQISYAVFCL